MKKIGVNLNFVKTIRLGFYVFFCVLFLSGFFIFSCGSKGQETSKIFSGKFTPSFNGGNSNTIYLDTLNPETDEFFILDVNAFNIIPFVVRAEFNIFFSGSVVRYEDFIAGDFFGTEEDVQYEITQTPSNIHVSISKKDLTQGINGDGKLISLRFRLAGFGNSGFLFNDQELFQANGVPLLFVINWFGGNISVT